MQRSFSAFDVNGRTRVRLRYLLIAIWALLTLSLSGWWLYFGVQQSRRVVTLENDPPQEFLRIQSMLLWEGFTLFCLVVVGAVAIGYFSYREARESRRLREFLATFAHEIKTPLAAVRLQAELLRESDAPAPKIVGQLLEDTARLALQLDNSLALSTLHNVTLHREVFDLHAVIRQIGDRWSKLRVIVSGSAQVKGDVRLVNSMIENVLHNALVHGEASEVTMEIRPVAGATQSLHIRDNGKGFHGEPGLLGRPFARPTKRSGSGIGLFLVAEFAKRLGWRARFEPHQSGFEVIIEGLR